MGDLVSPDLSNHSTAQLLALYGEILDELKMRGITRTHNNPVADYAELLVAHALQLKLAGNSNAGYDAVDPGGVRYQIKGRRLRSAKGSRQLSHIRGLAKSRFDFLIGVLFDAQFAVLEAYVIPHAVVAQHAGFRESLNAHILKLQGGVLLADGVVRIDEKLKASVAVLSSVRQVDE